MNKFLFLFEFRIIAIQLQAYQWHCCNSGSCKYVSCACVSDKEQSDTSFGGGVVENI